MERVTVSLPVELKKRAESYASDQGMTLSELIQEGLALALEPEEKPLQLKEDVFVDDGLGYSGEEELSELVKER